MNDLVERPDRDERITPKRFSCISLDGASTMSGDFSGVKTRFQYAMGAHVIYVWCSSHKLSLAVNWASQYNLNTLSAVNSLRDIYYYLHNSSVRYGEYLETIKDMRKDPLYCFVPNQKLICSADTRWMTNEEVAKILLNTWPIVYGTVEDFYAEDRDATSLGILITLRSPTFIASLFLLCTVFELVNPLNLALQKSRAFLATVPQLLRTLTHDLGVLAECTRQNVGTTYAKWSVFYNTHISPHSKKKVTDLGWQKFHDTTTVPYVRELKKQLATRFDNLGFMEAIACFDPQTVFADRESEEIKCVNTLVTYYGTAKSASVTGKPTTTSAPVWDAEYCSRVRHQLPQLFQALRTARDSAKDPSLFTFEDGLKYACAREATSLPVAVDVMMLVASFPVGTVDVERAFSVLKLIMTPLRNRLRQDTLDMLIRIKMEGTEQPGDDFLEKVVDRFVKMSPQGGRRVNF